MKKEKAFTLIEILLVIGLIAILAAIVIIAINPARQFAQARDTQRANNIRAISDAIYQYVIDNKGEFPEEIDNQLRMIGSSGSGCNFECKGELICTGYEWDGHCWYEGDTDLNCTSVCSDHGGTEGTCQENDNSSCDLCHHFHPGAPCQSQSFGMAPFFETGGGSCRYRAPGTAGTCGGRYYNRYRFCACKGDLAETENSCIDLEGKLENYLPDIPYDPEIGSREKTYYAVKKIGEGRITIIACNPETEEIIEIKK